MHVYTHVDTHVDTHVYTHVYTHVDTQVHAHVYTGKIHALRILNLDGNYVEHTATQLIENTSTRAHTRICARAHTRMRTHTHARWMADLTELSLSTNRVDSMELSIARCTMLRSVRLEQNMLMQMPYRRTYTHTHACIRSHMHVRMHGWQVWAVLHNGDDSTRLVFQRHRPHPRTGIPITQKAAPQHNRQHHNITGITTTQHAAPQHSRHPTTQHAIPQHNRYHHKTTDIPTSQQASLLTHSHTCTLAPKHPEQPSPRKAVQPERELQLHACMRMHASIRR